MFLKLSLSGLLSSLFKERLQPHKTPINIASVRRFILKLSPFLKILYINNQIFIGDFLKLMLDDLLLENPF